MKIYAVIDDYGDNWANGPIANRVTSLEAAQEWAEEENFHSASIVCIENGVRTKVN